MLWQDLDLLDAPALISPTKRDDILTFVRNYYRRVGNFPTVREIVFECGISSTSMTTYYLDVMERRGDIVRINTGENHVRRYTLPEVLRLLEGLK